MVVAIGRGAAGTAVVLMLGLSASARAATLNATATTLDAAWKAAAPGDTIKLSGSFGLTRLSWKSQTKAITLDLTKAVFTNTLNISHVDGLKVVGGKFDVTSGVTQYGRAVVVYGGSNIWFDKTYIVGVGNQQGIAFNDTVKASVSRGTFKGLYVGVALTRVEGGNMTKNNVTAAVSDGIDIGDSHHVTATYNSCLAGNPGAGVHPDCIQLWSVDGRPIQSDNVISYNNAVGPTQGFTSFTAGGGGLRISFLHNTVTSSYPQGVACYDCVDSTISYNSVKTIPGSRFMTNINVIGGSNNTMVGNTIGVPVGLTKSPDIIPNTSATVDSFITLPPVGDTSESSGALLARQSLGATAGAGAVPEPQAWLLMLIGFGAVGAAARRRGARAVAA